MKLVLRLKEKPKYKDSKFSKLTVQWKNVSLEFSYRGRMEHINLFSFDEEKNIVTIDNLTIVIGVIWGVKDYRYGQSYETLPDEDKEIIRQALQSDKSVLTVFDDNWLDLGAEFVDLY